MEWYTDTETAMDETSKFEVLHSENVVNDVLPSVNVVNDEVFENAENAENHAHETELHVPTNTAFVVDEPVHNTEFEVENSAPDTTADELNTEFEVKIIHLVLLLMKLDLILNLLLKMMYLLLLLS